MENETRPSSAATDGTNPGAASAPNPAGSSSPVSSTRDSLLAAAKGLREGKTVDEVKRDNAAPVEGGNSDGGSEPEARGADMAGSAGKDAGSAASAQPSGSQSQSNTPDLDKARRALKRARYPDDILSQLPEARVLELGSALLADQAASDNFGNEVTRLKRELDKATKASSSRTNADGNADGRGSVSDGLDGGSDPQDGSNQAGDATAKTMDDSQGLADFDVDQLLEPLRGDAFMAAAAEPLANFARATKEQLRKTQQLLQQQEQSRENEIKQVYALVDRMKFDLVRSELRESFPELKDDANWKKVTGRARALANLEGYHDANGEPDFAKLVRDATNLELKPIIEAGRRNRQNARHDAMTQGQPLDLGGDDRPGNSKPMSTRERLIVAARDLGAGNKPDAVRSKLARL